MAEGWLLKTVTVWLPHAKAQKSLGLGEVVAKKWQKGSRRIWVQYQWVFARGF